MASAGDLARIGVEIVMIAAATGLRVRYHGRGTVRSRWLRGAPGLIDNEPHPRILKEWRLVWVTIAVAAGVGVAFIAAAIAMAVF